MITTNIDQLELIKQQIIDERVCADLAKQATQLVFGTGYADADIVFIGEAPGKQEDLQGEPFVGASGKFLNELLAMIGLSRDKIYITNIVKYRPPNNRDPSSEEKASFLPFLYKQLDIINPKLIVTLGRHSMNVLLPGLKISQAHGQPQRIKMRSRQLVDSSVDKNHKEPTYIQRAILPLFHPAAALYNGSLRQTILDDFASIPLILAKISTIQIKQHFNT